MSLGGCAGGAFTAGTWAEQLILGLILGSIYALIALGYTLVYGVIKLINFAHGDIYMVGAFAGYYIIRFVMRWLNFEGGLPLVWCFAITVLVSALICAAIAVLMERLAYRPLRKSSRIAALITAVGISFLLENLGIIAFGANPKSYIPKTFAVYQVQTSSSGSFGDSATQEIYDSTQRSYPAQRFSKPVSVRVRLIGRKGASDWSPVLQVDPGEKSGFVEAAAAADPDARKPGAPGSLGFRYKDERGKPVLVLNWDGGKGADTQQPPIFADAEGRPLTVTLPINSGSGERLRVPLFSICIVVFTAMLLGALNLLISRSMFGISMRALSFDLSAAKLMGVNTDLVIAQTFALGGACAAIAGNFVGLYNQSIDPLMGILPGLKAFIAAVVGGIGSIPGAAVGGLIMGVSEALLKTVIPSKYSTLADAGAFAILIAVLLLKPSGIFGRALKEKV